MNNPLPVTSLLTVNVVSKKTIPATITIVDHIASLHLPKFPVKLVGGLRLSATDLRCKAALAVYAVLPGLDLAILPTVATASKLSVKDALIACKDLIACGLVTTRIDDHARNVYAVRSGS